MLKFVNAKINLGLAVTSRREDGYHLLNTGFYPVGLFNGMPCNPEPFCDMLELTGTDSLPGSKSLAGGGSLLPGSESLSGGGSLLPGSESLAGGGSRPEAEDGYYLSPCGIAFVFEGNRIECRPEKNLVVRAAELFCGEYAAVDSRGLVGAFGPVVLRLAKCIPDGAGLGGGSADATFTLRMLNEYCGCPFDTHSLQEMALRLGADCPVFVDNIPVYAEGIGEIFFPMESESVERLHTDGYRLALVKPDLHISTREAFAGLTPACPEIPVREALRRDIEEWRHCLFNDFEKSLFPLYPELSRLKACLYDRGAIYASMTGSGAALYGIFRTHREAAEAVSSIAAPYGTVIML